MTSDKYFAIQHAVFPPSNWRKKTLITHKSTEVRRNNRVMPFKCLRQTEVSHKKIMTIVMYFVFGRKLSKVWHCFRRIVLNSFGYSLKIRFRINCKYDESTARDWNDILLFTWNGSGINVDLCDLIKIWSMVKSRFTLFNCCIPILKELKI